MLFQKKKTSRFLLVENQGVEKQGVEKQGVEKQGVEKSLERSLQYQITDHQKEIGG